MDLKGSIVDTNLRIYPSNPLLKYLKSIPFDDNVPLNIAKFVKGKDYKSKSKTQEDEKNIPVHLNTKDIENLNKIKETIKVEEAVEDIESASDEETTKTANNTDKSKDSTDVQTISETSESQEKKSKEKCNEKTKKDDSEREEKLYLTTSDVDWLYAHLQKLRSKGGKDVPYLHALLEGSQIEPPENQVLKRNPVLEARCVKLRAQQEAREYRKMTKSVDNVRMRFPEDSINYQLKQVNRQLIAIGQFIISIFAGFLFGFKGVDWMVGPLDFGFRLLLGVMCALIIALAEIYFLAKKLNEELNVPETVQLGGPPKFVDEKMNNYAAKTNKAIDKQHQD